MTYLDYIIQFQRLRRQQPFSSVEADLYNHLVWTANCLGWKNPFNEGNPIIMASLGMSDKTLMSARTKLISTGLIRFTPGKKGCYSTYELLSLRNTTEIFRGIPELSGSSKGPIGGQSGGNTPSYNRSKIKSKKTGATAPVRVSESLPVREPWATWLAEHAPDVQRLKSPLTGKQWAALVTDFGQTLVQDVFLAMQNKADLLKSYTSANLTARDWCKRRLPAGYQLPQPRISNASLASIEPEINPDVVAEREAERQAASQERARKFRARATPIPENDN